MPVISLDAKTRRQFEQVYAAILSLMGRVRSKQQVASAPAGP